MYHQNAKTKQSIEFPPRNELSYDRYLVGILESDNSCEFNFVFSDDTISFVDTPERLQVNLIEPGEIKKIVCWYR